MGRWVPGPETQGTVDLTVQPASEGERGMLVGRALPEGFGLEHMLRAYGPDTLRAWAEGAGDTVLHEGRRYRVFARQRRDDLNDPDLEHTKYLLVLEQP